MPFDRVTSDRVVEMMFLLRRPSHKWFWLSKQQSDEPLLFVTWDSADLDDISRNGAFLVRNHMKFLLIEDQDACLTLLSTIRCARIMHNLVKAWKFVQS